MRVTIVNAIIAIIDEVSPHVVNAARGHRLSEAREQFPMGPPKLVEPKLSPLSSNNSRPVSSLFRSSFFPIIYFGENGFKMFFFRFDSCVGIYSFIDFFVHKYLLTLALV